MFISGGLIIVLAAILLILCLLILSGKLNRLGRLPGDIRHKGRRTRVYAPLTSMLLLSLLFSLVLFLLSLVF